MAVNFRKVLSTNVIETTEKNFVTTTQKGLIDGSSQKASNLSDLADVGSARSNLGLGTAAVLNTGEADGDIPILGTGGKLAEGIMPALAISSTTVVADIAARDALGASSQEGDVAVVTDTGVDSDGNGTNDSRTYIYDGASWIELKADYSAVSTVNGESGAVLLNPADLNGTLVTDVEFEYLSGVTSAIQTQLDNKQVSGTYNTVIGTDVAVSATGATVISSLTLDDGVITASGTRTLTLADLSVTSTVAELNILDGALLDVTELNILDGALVTTAELNILDGVTVGATEINYLTGLGENISTSLANKLDDTQLSIDGTLGGNSDTEIPSEKAVKTYVDGAVSSNSPGVTTSLALAVATSTITLASAAQGITSIYVENEGLLLTGWSHTKNTTTITLDDTTLDTKNVYVTYLDLAA